MQTTTSLFLTVAALLTAAATSVLAQYATPNGQCGNSTGFICTTPEFGPCCSSYGYWCPSPLPLPIH
jgi:hypothetical protein